MHVKIALSSTGKLNICKKLINSSLKWSLSNFRGSLHICRYRREILLKFILHLWRLFRVSKKSFKTIGFNL